MFQSQRTVEFNMDAGIFAQDLAPFGLDEVQISFQIPGSTEWTSTLSLEPSLINRTGSSKVNYDQPFSIPINPKESEINMRIETKTMGVVNNRMHGKIDYVKLDKQVKAYNNDYLILNYFPKHLNRHLETNLSETGSPGEPPKVMLKVSDFKIDS